MSTILPIDAIQEFNLEENPKAEYGWKPGAVVNVGIPIGDQPVPRLGLRIWPQWLLGRPQRLQPRSQPGAASRT
jgi:hypothetical protein